MGRPYRATPPMHNGQLELDLARGRAVPPDFALARSSGGTDYIVIAMACAAFIALLANAFLFGASAMGIWPAANWSSPAVVALIGVAVVSGMIFIATAWLAAQRLAAEADALDALYRLDEALEEAEAARAGFARARSRWIASQAG